MKPIIGIDMDDTIENLLIYWVEMLNETYGTNVNWKDIKGWIVSDYFPTLTNDQVIGMLSNEELWRRVQPKSDAQRYVKQLIDEGYPVYICTSSHFGTVEMKMKEVLFKYFPYLKWSQVIVCAKKQICNFDILIDDYYKNLIDGPYKGILITTPANKDEDLSKYPYIIRKDNWEEIYKYIKEEYAA